MSTPFFTMQDYLRNTQHLALEAQSSRMSQWTNDDDESSILDENILESTIDASAFDISPVDQRRSSMVDAAIFSPHLGNDWGDYEPDLSTIEQPPLVSSFDNASYVKTEANMGQFSMGTWTSNDALSGSCTPTQYSAHSATFPSVDFDAVNFPAFTAGSTFDSVPIMTPLNVCQPVPQTHGVSIPSTPLTTGWTTPVEQVDTRQIVSNGVKRMRPGSPIPRVHSPVHMRRDGIRKKNARFDIPAERTLLNIDHLIAQSGDDNEIKELKQQKRLLRNRQAALDSRQRKKQHTERLEEEKKMHNAYINELEEKLNALVVREEEVSRRERQLRDDKDMMQQHLYHIQLENEEMLRKHTLETGELRKKNTFLLQQLEQMQQKLDQVSLNMTTPTPENYEEYTFNNMPMDTFWEPPSFPGTSETFHDVPTTAEQVVPTAIVKQEISVPSSTAKEEEKPASGLLFLLLLFGAFVASKATPASTLPPIPGQLRTASAAVLNTIFEDAGVKSTSALASLPPMSSGVQSSVPSAASQQISETWVTNKADHSQMIGLESSLAMLNSRLGQTTREQEEQQMTMLTEAEYTDLTSNNFIREQQDTTSQGRIHLQETLNALRSGNKKESAAEVYTRSLLWDKVDAEVVRRFAAFAQQAAMQTASENDAAYSAQPVQMAA